MLDNIRKELAGFTHNVAVSNEQEVVESVLNHLQQQGHEILDFSLNEKLRNRDKRIVAEFDALIFLRTGEQFSDARIGGCGGKIYGGFRGA